VVVKVVMVIKMVMVDQEEVEVVLLDMQLSFIMMAQEHQLLMLVEV
jgi:hypothetical protein